MCLVNCEQSGTAAPSRADISYGEFNDDESGAATRPPPTTWLFDLAAVVGASVPLGVAK